MPIESKKMILKLLLSEIVGMKVFVSLNMLLRGWQGGLESGHRVLMASAGSFSTFSRCSIAATCKIPEVISFTEAAAILAKFGTAWAVIHDIARIQTGESILIHTRRVGQDKQQYKLHDILVPPYSPPLALNARSSFSSTSMGFQRTIYSIVVIPALPKVSTGWLRDAEWM